MFVALSIYCMFSHLSVACVHTSVYCMCSHLSVVGVDKHQVSCHRPAVQLCFLHQLAAVEPPGLEDNGHVEEVFECVCVVVDLPVCVWEGPKVGAVHCGEGS